MTDKSETFMEGWHIFYMQVIVIYKSVLQGYSIRRLILKENKIVVVVVKQLGAVEFRP